MQNVLFELGYSRFPIEIPEHTDVLRMGKPEVLRNPSQAIVDALRSPVNCPPLSQIIRDKLRSNPNAEAVIVISDNTRPVPYSGESDILFPIINEIMRSGLSPKNIHLLVATGTHRTMDEQELREMIDPRTLALDLSITSHDSRNMKGMIKVCHTEYGGDIFVNRIYIQSDIKSKNDRDCWRKRIFGLF